MRKYSASIMLEGVLFDASIILKTGDTRRAFKVLRHKLDEIQKIDESDWGEISW